ncbi:hypothetical protein H9L17_04325 [Thermomonas brevis]|uniref:Uncharacterized protein n=1 Tax=Thermomonas brevis TaxID=215691 RepID=A0A7G9QVK9_9GAMM|nr:hypothetical protein [Thermomonas brevis]QNN47384.1 hypothetical protein H9L17_04325 [Thermomonas brevis]
MPTCCRSADAHPTRITAGDSKHEKSETTAIAILLTAAALVGAAIACDTTLVTIAPGMPAQGGEAVVAVASLDAALAAIAFGIRELRRMRRGRLTHA